jgi:hypothetical protein
MDNFDNKIFKGKSFSDLLGEIYTNQKKKEKQVSALIGELKPLINDIGDATLIVPLIKEYMEIGVKNDEHLIKMATIVQRAMGKSEGGDDGALTEEEKAQLLEEVKKMGNKKDK